MRTAAIVLASLLLVLGGSFAFDRDNDGDDDGGLSFLAEARVEIPLLLFVGFIPLLPFWTCVSHHYRFGSAPRSPPAV